MTIFSLSSTQKQQIIENTEYYIKLANQQLDLNLVSIPLCFDLKGRASGMFVVKPAQVYIRYNEIIFSEYFDDALVNTVAHEVAHYVVHSIWGIKRVKPHGQEWKKIMGLFGVSPEVTSCYDVSTLPLHRQKQFEYVCACMSHSLSTTRHNKVQRNKAIYKCRKCMHTLKWQALSS